MNVISLFDGMSCGILALQKAGIEFDSYHASEIDITAINVSKANNPQIKQLGNVLDVKGNSNIDLVIGGSPCQNFSRANSSRLGLDGEKSKLFYEWVRIFEECNPRYFLLENVIMDKKDQDVITKILGVSPININSSSVSAAHRNRLYWTNLPYRQVHGSNIILKNILSDGFTNMKKARALLVSDSRPLATPLKMYHRYATSGFTTLIFKDVKHYNDCKNHYNMYNKGKPIENHTTSDVYNGLRYLTTEERELCHNIPKGYCKSLTTNEAASVIGNGWTVDVIANFFTNIK